ncbi:MAG: glycosyltransferase family 2 protein [Acidobacteriia bacterium]|nr:glycosyltransferase family 2 protein [Terriglobia bacterium]
MENDALSGGQTVVAGSDHLKLIVCIAAHNVSGLLRECLRSVFASQTSFPFRVVVNDDGSNDDTHSMVAHEFPSVHLMRNEKPLGFAKANNQMLRRYLGRADFYLLLNDDTVVKPDALEELVSFAESHPQAGIVGGKLVKRDGTLDWPCKRSFQTPSVFFYRALGLDRLFPRSKRFGRYHLTYLDPDRSHEVDSVCGALLMMRHETLEQVGLLDEALFMYSEDMDWCYRTKHAGWTVYYYPKAVVIHHKSASSKKRNYRMIYWWYHSTWMVYRKSMSARYNPLANALVFLGVYFMLGVSLLANFLRPAKALPSRR